MDGLIGGTLLARGTRLSCHDGQDQCCTRWQHRYTSRPVPTARPRISVTKDPSLADALDRGRTLLGSAPEATLVHDLAVHGARLLAVERERRQHALGELADHDWLDGVLDFDALATFEDDHLPIAL